MASVQGWGRLTWGSGTWGQYAPVEATGVSLTSSTTTPTVVTEQIISVTGLGTTLSTGDATAVGIANAIILSIQIIYLLSQAWGQLPL